MTKTWTEQVVVILNRSSDNLLGAELRNLKEEKAKRIYKVLDFEYLYKRVYPDKEIDEMEMITYKKISHLINILNVNFESKITLFEGYFDSMFFPNSIGMVGKSTSIDILINNELDVRFVFDGKDKSVELIDKGYSVFLWNKLFEDLKIKNPKEKDINKLVEKYKNPNLYSDLKLEKYFSRDSFDKIWI